MIHWPMAILGAQFFEGEDMRRHASLIFCMGLALAVVGCGDDETGPGGGTGGTGTGGTGGTGGGAGEMALVTGTVSEAVLEGEPAALGGAMVTVVGGASTTSNPDGSFEVMAPVGTVMFLTTASGAWGSLVADDVPAGGLTGLEIEVVPDVLVNAVAGALETVPDPDKGAVAVSFDDTTVSGDETATIDATSEISFVFDAADDPSEGNTLIPGGGTEVIFFNVEPTNAVTTTASNAINQPCPLEFPAASYSVQAKVFTDVEVFCP